MNYQVELYDLETKTSSAGILLENGDCICMCCGGTISGEEIAVNVTEEVALNAGYSHLIKEIYSDDDDWIDMSNQMLCFMKIAALKKKNPSVYKETVEKMVNLQVDMNFVHILKEAGDKT